MDKIIELREKRAKAWEAAKAFLDTKRGTDGIVSAEDTATYDKMEADVVALGKEIDRLEKQAAIDRELALPTSTPITEKPMTAKKSEKVGRASEDYHKAFWNHTRKRDSYDVRNALQIGADSEGGYLVPDEFEHQLITALDAENIIRQHAHVFSTSSGNHKIPVVSTRGTATWVDEEGVIPESDDAFGQQLIGAHKVSTLIKVSEELLQDSAFDLEGYFAREFARRIGNKEEEAFITGNGAAKPTGIMNTAEIGVTAASTTAITADEIIDLFYSLKSPYRKNAIWVMSDSTVKVIRKLKDSNGQYLWQPAFRENEFDTILGKRIFTSPYAPEIGAGVKSIAFGDFSYYWIGDRSGITFKRLNERYAETGQVGFIASKRVDAKLILPEAIKVLCQKGTPAVQSGT